MRVALLVVIAACGKSSPTAPDPGSITAAAPRPPDDMDEKMRHCPLAVSGTRVTYQVLADSIRWQLAATSEPVVAELRKRAKHIVEFAAGKAAKGEHGGGKGGGTMRNCPVVTSGVLITESDVDGGAVLVVTPIEAGEMPALGDDTRARVKAFAFPEVSVLEQR